MSQKKIIFFIIAGIILVSLIAGIAYISGQTKTEKVQGSIKIWINDGTTESYASLIEGFRQYAPEFKSVEIVFEKQSSDPDRYRTLLLSTLTEGSGPDIFMLRSGEDILLENKLEPIPSDVLDFSDFDKKYDDLFQDLVYSTGSGKGKQTFLKGVPLGYETLGVFYNKSILREVPKTWNDLENLYKDLPAGKYPSNLGLGPTFVPNMIDILPLWLQEEKVKDYTQLSNGGVGFESYMNYGNIGVGGQRTGEDETVISKRSTFALEKSRMIEEKLTSLDLFMQGEIGMVIGYPSLILELEKSSKRAGESSSNAVILTDRIPQSSATESINIARYTYFGISKLTTNPTASLKFLEYLMTPEAERLFSEQYPYLIPAQAEFYDAAGSNSLSETLARTKLNSFIPKTGDKISVFQYGIKSRFEKYLKEGIDSVMAPDLNDVLDKISKELSCEINTSINGSEDTDCQK
ncbi:extracellular solute-binding protein [Candidatus Gracilibacteria bacterium]|nr:extracellular solute-binding protein [Candidatus Gracilibacteria bacterium]